MSEIYDSIGGSYGVTRRQDPRIAAAINEALVDVRSQPDMTWLLGFYPSNAISDPVRGISGTGICDHCRSLIWGIVFWFWKFEERVVSSGGGENGPAR